MNYIDLLHIAHCFGFILRPLRYVPCWCRIRRWIRLTKRETTVNIYGVQSTKRSLTFLAGAPGLGASRPFSRTARRSGKSTWSRASSLVRFTQWFRSKNDHWWYSSTINWKSCHQVMVVFGSLHRAVSYESQCNDIGVKRNAVLSHSLWYNG